MTDHQPTLTAFGADAPDALRRKLLKAAMALGAVGGMLAHAPFQPVFAAADAAPESAAAFRKLAQFLTSKQVNAVLAGRYYAALKKRHPDLDNSVAALAALVGKEKLAHMDDYLALQDVDKALDTHAKTIVKAMYLGVVGDDENAELIAYKEAFMYKPTEDVLVVPTYGRGPGSWGTKPTEKKA
jgi:hypothetical protein